MMLPSDDKKVPTGAYVPPHRRNRKVVTAPSLEATEARTTLTTTTSRGRPAQKTRTHHHHHNRPRRDPGGENDTSKEKDNHDIDLLCSVLTRICCINLQSRPDKWQRILQQARRVDARFADKIERFDAIKGCPEEMQDLVQREWDATQNAQYSSRVTVGSIKTMTAGEVGCALSHVELWKQQLLCQEEKSNNAASSSRDDDAAVNTGTDFDFESNNKSSSSSCMLILEDDIVFTSKRGKSRFARAFSKAWKLLPSNWSILYLGFSGRGERFYVENDDEKHTHHHDDHRQSHHRYSDDDPRVQLYRPTYGFHTHAYVINTTAAATLLEHLPIVGPIDVWLADNAWFGLSVYCAVIANEGWKCEDGTYEGANLVSQDRKHHKSDVQQSAHVS